MSSEALLENPKLFAACGDGDLQFRTNYVESQLTIAEQYLALACGFRAHMARPECVRGHLFKILHRFLTVPRHVDLRERLAAGTVADMERTVADLRKRTRDCDPALAEQHGFIGTTTWYMRHRPGGAKPRILSVPRRRSSVLERENSKEYKMEQLKKRYANELAARRTGDTDSTLPIPFARGMKTEL
jgi:hypothetical protein